MDEAREMEWSRAHDVVVGVAVFAKNADDLFTLTPVRRLQMLRVAQTKMTMADLAAVGGVRRLRGLSLRNSTLGDERVRDLLRAVSMPDLEELDLTGCDLGNQALAALSTADLPRLGLPECRGADQTGCVLSWQTFAEPADRHALRIAVISLGGELAFGLCSDPQAIGELTRLAEAFEEAVVELEEAVA